MHNILCRASCRVVCRDTKNIAILTLTRKHNIQSKMTFDYTWINVNAHAHEKKSWVGSGWLHQSHFFSVASFVDFIFSLYFMGHFVNLLKFVRQQFDKIFILLLSQWFVNFHFAIFHESTRFSFHTFLESKYCNFSFHDPDIYVFSLFREPIIL